jgi:hypothetical protein
MNGDANLAAFWSWLESLPLSVRIAETWWFPLLESLHVLGIVLMIGFLLSVDLRLLGVAARRYAVSGLSRELLAWTWCAFALAVLTGLGLFITRAAHYASNSAFQIKLILLLLAGVNMAVFHYGIFRSVAGWDRSSPPFKAKVVAALSLLIWSGAVLAGRWVGHLS